MQVTVSQITIGGSGDPRPASSLLYEKDYVSHLKGQTNAVDVRQISVIYHSSNTTAIIAVDSAGNALSNLSDLAILPCPPFCDKSGTYIPLSFAEFRLLFLI